MIGRAFRGCTTGRGFLVELARGRSGAPCDWLAAVGGFTYLGAYVYGTRR